MPVPWEALIPIRYVSPCLLTSMFAVAGTLLNTSKRAQNQWKPVRYNIDAWEEMMMDRDRRLTGHLRGQKTDTTPPEGFETSSAWYSRQVS
ncbi:small secreted protein [Melanogaster broomeanus]|nr:small secreted protein [Melanogaster broomeanus]